MKKVMICTPCYGQMVTEPYLRSIMASQNALSKDGFRFYFMSYGNESLITRARNNLLAGFFGSDAEILMFIDADIGWTPAALKEILESEHAVCGIPYPVKGYNWDALYRLISNDRSEDLQASLSPEKMRIKAMSFTLDRSAEQPKDIESGWVKVDSLGTGFMAIKRDALEKMKEHYWDALSYVNDVKGYRDMVKDENCVALFDTMIDPQSRRYLSEDYAFCRRWRDLGGEIYACRKYKLSHTGTHVF